MTVHFVCRGNVYRSRLAEAYLKSKNIQGIKVISSGIEADNNLSGPISWYAQRITQKNHLTAFEKSIWNQTTKELLSEADYTVFMQKDIYDYCINNLGFNNKNFEVWNISDLLKGTSENEKIKASEKTFEEIKKRVDKLLAKSTFTGRVE